MRNVALTVFVLFIMLFSLGSIWITYKRDKERERRRNEKTVIDNEEGTGEVD